MRFLLLLLITLLSVLPQETFAQQTEKEETIATLNAKKEEVGRAEKEALKIEVLAINKRGQTTQGISNTRFYQAQGAAKRRCQREIIPFR